MEAIVAPAAVVAALSSASIRLLPEEGTGEQDAVVSACFAYGVSCHPRASLAYNVFNRFDDLMGRPIFAGSARSAFNKRSINEFYRAAAGRVWMSELAEARVLLIEGDILLAIQLAEELCILGAPPPVIATSVERARDAARMADLTAAIVDPFPRSWRHRPGRP